MSLPPASDGIMPHHYSPPVQPPLLPHQSELFGYDRSQPNSWDMHFNNHHHTSSFDPTASFPTSASNAPHVPQGSAQSLGPSHLPFLNDQSLLGPIPSTEPFAMLNGPRQYLSTNQKFQAWPTCTCRLCSAHPTFWPVGFDDGWSAFAGRDAVAPSATPPSRRASSRANRAAPLHAMSSVRSAQAQFPGVVNAGRGSWNLRNAAGGGSARPSSSRPGGAASVQVGSARGRRRRRPSERARPLVRVEDRIKWVRDDVMEMTLLFNWSPHAEAEAHEPWG